MTIQKSKRVWLILFTQGRKQVEHLKKLVCGNFKVDTMMIKDTGQYIQIPLK